MEEQIILVDDNDVQVGQMGKLETHIKGLLHRAFSVYVKNSKGEIMLQKRGDNKYHSGGLWTNTCCSHPRIGEKLEDAVHRRLVEEMGFDCPLQEICQFTYRGNLDKGLVENEFLHVFTGKFDGRPTINPEEASDWKWVSLEEVKSDIKNNPDKYTYWFKITLEKLEEMNIKIY